MVTWIRFAPIFLLFFCGCIADVPHENPLDPLSPSYVAGGIVKGRVFLKNQLGTPVPSALISNTPGTIVTFSDSSGIFSFSKFPVGNTTLIVSKTNFVPETLYVNLAAGEQKSYNVAMNAFPSVTSAKVTMHRIALWFPSTRYLGSFTATVDDLNGITDIDTVWLATDSLSFPMTYSIAERNFQLTINPEDLPGNNLQILVGKPIFVYVSDIGGATAKSSPFYTSRIIEEEPLPLYPTSIPVQDTIKAGSSNLVFRWNEPKATFDFTFSIMLMRIDYANNKTVVWSAANIPSYEFSNPYNGTSLTVGNYSWTLSIVDEFANSSVSKEYSFVVR